ncbi:MAG: tail fiber domain-containing protein, partial [Chitinophagales bacterium]
TTGSNNVATGAYALYQNTTGNDNTATGYNALYTNTIGMQNVAIGKSALYSNEDGNDNTAIGYQAMLDNVYGFQNTALGSSSLVNNISGSYNCAIGSNSLKSNTEGNYNTAVGESAMLNNDIGWDNAAFGYFALKNNTGADENSAFGSNALKNATTGAYNTASGYKALVSVVTGDGNTGAGYMAMQTVNGGDYNTGVGYMADANTAGLSNTIAIGNSVGINVSNKARMGNSSISSNGGQVSWTAYSDERIKNNVQENVPGLAFINKLRPVTYHFDIHKQNSIEGMLNDNDWEGKYDIEKMQWTGFIAQEVDAAAQEIGYDFSGVDKSGELYGLRYAEFVVPLVKAVQEMDSSVQEKDAQMAEMQDEIITLQAQLDALQALVESGRGNENSSSSEITLTDEKTSVCVALNGAWLEQNVPNPFTGTTIIRCYIPEGSGSAELIISAQNGVTLKRTALTESGINEIRVDASAISAGAYQYTLIVDGEIVGTKQMLLAN